jgi:hypothetical protein
MVVSITLLLGIIFPLVQLYASLIVFWFLILLLGVPLKGFVNKLHFLK